MNDWQRDKERADIFMPAIKKILGLSFIGEACAKQDQEEATDLLLVLKLDQLTIACRMRNLFYLANYPHDVTIRYSRPSGAKTEYDKIIDGWANYFFYGFGDFETGQISAYTILSLKAFRAAVSRKCFSYTMSFNKDGTRFIAIDSRTLPEDCIYKKDHPSQNGFVPRPQQQQQSLFEDCWRANS